MENTAMFDKEKAKRFMGKFQQDLASSMAARMCALGDRLGLFQVLVEKGALTSEQLAEEAEIDERYAREWLQGMTAAGYLEVDPANMAYLLPAEHKMPLADDTNPLFQGGILELMVHSMTPFEELVEAFKTGGGVAQSSFHPKLYDGMGRSSAVRYRNLLLQQWIPSMPDVQAKLEKGVDVADIGCGNGLALLMLAEAFPNSNFVGYDAFPPQVEGANKRAKEAGVADHVHFEVVDGAEPLPSEYDVIFTFDVIHDMPRPREALKNIREHLKPNGVYVMQEITAEDELHANVGPMATLKYGMSLHYCMTTSLANGGEGLGTCGMPDNVVREMTKEAGFSKVVKADCSNDFVSLYEVWP